MALGIDVGTGRTSSLIGAVVTAVLVLTVLAALTSTFFDAVNDLTTNMTDNDTTTGVDSADNLLSSLDAVVALVAVVGFLGLVFAAFAVIET